MGSSHSPIVLRALKIFRDILNSCAGIHQVVLTATSFLILRAFHGKIEEENLNLGESYPSFLWNRLSLNYPWKLKIRFLWISSCLSICKMSLSQSVNPSVNLHQPCHSPLMVFCSSSAFYLGFSQCPLWSRLVFPLPYFKLFYNCIGNGPALRFNI